VLGGDVRSVHRNLARVHVQHDALRGIQAWKYVDAIREALIEGGIDLEGRFSRR
jgi:hypothetical protein